VAVRRVLTLGVLGGALVVTSLAGCGLPTMSEPAAIDQAAVPTPAARGSHSDSLLPGGTAELYFVSGERMVRAVRRAPVAGNAAQVIERTLAQLVSGPDETERSAGLSSAIPPGLTLTLVKLSGGLAVVDIVGTDPGPAADQAHLATAQVVLTLTALPLVDSVMLTRNGRPLEAALPDGELTALPLTERDFTVLVQH
jgi:spore germination protein GerM